MDTSRMNPPLSGEEFREGGYTEPMELNIVGEAFFETFTDKNGKETENLYMYVAWNGSERKVRVNEDNWKAIKKAWGSESNEWAGKKK